MFAKRRVGKTEVETSLVSFGTTGIANIFVEVSEEAAQAVLEAAWQSGIRYFDTAPHYGRGRAEARLGVFLATKSRDEIVISTKVGRVLRPGKQLAVAEDFVNPLPNDVHYDYSAKGFEESLASSVERLGTDRIDIVFVHDIGVVTHGAGNAAHMKDLLESGLPYLESLKEQGRIGAYGLGVNENEVCVEVLKSHPLDVILLAGRWTLLDRTAEAELIPMCREMGVSLVLGGVFNSGILATGPTEGARFNYAPASADILAQTRALEEKCAAFDVPLATAALHFGFSKPEAASVLIGTGKVSSLTRNLEAIQAPFPEALAKEVF
ncbi:aldo/keto reductase [Falsihalocynthiibacter sp. BN13B15]|uniref:aldo/keto reductase n=1 Tax=Falsihalocynthiibacter sp. BN13B15 TaxID=3240871 RepID=UPI00350FC625